MMQAVKLSQDGSVQANLLFVLYVGTINLKELKNVRSRALGVLIASLFLAGTVQLELLVLKSVQMVLSLAMKSVMQGSSQAVFLTVLEFNLTIPANKEMAPIHQSVNLAQLK